MNKFYKMKEYVQHLIFVLVSTSAGDIIPTISGFQMTGRGHVKSLGLQENWWAVRNLCTIFIIVSVDFKLL